MKDRQVLYRDKVRSKVKSERERDRERVEDRKQTEDVSDLR